MYSLHDNYLALYLSIIKRYNPDQSLNAMGVTEKNNPSNQRKVEGKPHTYFFKAHGGMINKRSKGEG